MPDPIFSDPRLAAVYDALEGERTDLDFYAELVNRYAARRVVDIGCGTGEFACMLADRGLDVIGVDPAEASLRIARQKPGANRVRWILGEASGVPPLGADMATMTGNVPQVFVADEDWSAALFAIRRTIRTEGHLVFETRIPDNRSWRDWNRAGTCRRIDISGSGTVTTWCEVTRVDGPLVGFRWTFEFESDGAVIVSDSVLRFRDRTELVRSLDQAGYLVEEILDAPDRPGRELVFVARNLGETGR